MSRSPKRSRIAQQVAGGRDLVVLVDGPWRHRWYWADDLAAMQHTAARYPLDRPAGQLRGYIPTTHRVPHPTDPELTGTAYRYAPEVVAGGPE